MKPRRPASPLVFMLATGFLMAAICLPYLAVDSHHAAFAAGKDKDKDKDKEKTKDKEKDKAQEKEAKAQEKEAKEKEKAAEKEAKESEKSKGKGAKSGSSDDDNSASDADASPSGEPNAGAPMVGAGHDRILRSEVVVADATPGLGAFAKAKGFRVLRTEQLAELGLNVMRLRAPDGLSTKQARDLITGNFPDAIVDFNHLYQPQASLSLPAADYGAKAVRWGPELQGCAVSARLGLIDSAVDWSLPILSGAHFHAANFLEGEAAPSSHGTGIATLLIGQDGFGLLPGAELYSAGIFGLDGDGRPVASATSFASALNWLLANKVATINVSLSGPPDRLMELAIKRAQERGVELVAAVGNDGATDLPRFPAAYPGVIGVTAVDQAGRIFSDANRGNFVALAAPGVDVLIPGQASGAGATDRLVTGTSFAVPYVTAALASYGNDPDRMFAGALDLGAPGADPVFGLGLVQGPKTCAQAAVN